MALRCCRRVRRPSHATSDGDAKGAQLALLNNYCLALQSVHDSVLELAAGTSHAGQHGGRVEPVMAPPASIVAAGTARHGQPAAGVPRQAAQPRQPSQQMLPASVGAEVQERFNDLLQSLNIALQGFKIALQGFRDLGPSLWLLLWAFAHAVWARMLGNRRP